MHMRVLVSGSSGLIGGAVVEHLVAHGDQVVRFDVAEGHDVLDVDDYAAAARGCDAIVHAAGGQQPDASDCGQRFVTHNVTGNWNMLEAARDAGIERVVTFSSVNAFGVFRGKGCQRSHWLAGFTGSGSSLDGSDWRLVHCHSGSMRGCGRRGLLWSCWRRGAADVLSRNRPMLNVFRRCGLPMAVRHEGDVIHVILSLREAG
jgi:hypothetical protein